MRVRAGSPSSLSLHHNILLQRRRAELRQYEAARAAGISASRLSRIEPGLVAPTADELARLGIAFGLGPAGFRQ